MNKRTDGKIAAIIVAGGKGNRLPLSVPKQYYKILDKPILAHTVDRFEKCDDIDEIVLVVGEDSADYCHREIAERYEFKKIKEIVIGGSERQRSVYNGLAALRTVSIVLIHDGVRPFVSAQNITDVVHETKKSGACVLAVPAKDTVKICASDMCVGETVKRSDVWLAQTPQGFRYDIILKAYMEASKENFFATDDSMLVERIGHPVKIVPGSYENIKITTVDDLHICEWKMKTALAD